MKDEEKARRKKAAWRLRCAQSLLSQAAQITDDMQAWNYVHAAWGSAGIALDRIEVVGKLANKRPRARA